MCISIEWNQVLSKNPYHIDALLQLAEAFTIMKDFESASDFIERILYAFESSWHPQFNPLRSSNQRLEYSHQENRFYSNSLIFIKLQLKKRVFFPPNQNKKQQSEKGKFTYFN
jgi:hypothetical protein